jgi:cellulose synthase/poly-beta-1,6-N-acetylglucosamine synthase-like glycosyltransferase
LAANHTAQEEGMTADRPPKVSFVVPVYNEMRTIEEILLQVQAVGLDKEIVIVDDGSTDGTRAFLITLEECAKHTPATMKLPRTGIPGGEG